MTCRWLCRWGLHKWSDWRDLQRDVNGRFLLQQRRCMRCSRAQEWLA